MSRVFITHEGPLDYSKAQAFGDLHPITSRDLSNTPNSQINRELVAQIKNKLNRFDPDEDYLLISGSPYVSSICTWVLGQLGILNFKILRWSNQDRVYYPIQL